MDEEVSSSLVLLSSSVHGLRELTAEAGTGKATKNKYTVRI